MDMLESKRLQKVISRIDDASDRLDELEREFESNPDFNNFVFEMMKQMGYYDENGNFLG